VGGADYRLPHTGMTDYAKDAPKIPAGAVTAEDADLIADLILQGPVKMKLILTPQTLPEIESANVIADIKGSEHPEQVVIVSGHLIGVNIKANPEVKKIFAPVANILQESGASILDLVEHCGADIEPLEKAGVPAFSPIQDSRFYFNYHHTAADTLDKIVPKELA